MGNRCCSRCSNPYIGCANHGCACHGGTKLAETDPAWVAYARLNSRFRNSIRFSIDDQSGDKETDGD